MASRDEKMNEIIFTLIPGIITAIFASYLTARWSLKKIYSEKWWERKEKAYSDIITRLYDLMQYCEYQRDHHEWGRKLAAEKEEELKNRYSEAYWKLKKATDIGGFVLSNEGAEVLKGLRNRPLLDWNENPPWDVYDQDYQYYKEALEKIVSVANKELKASKA